MDRYLSVNPPPRSPVTKRRKTGAVTNLKNVHIAVLGKDGVGKSAFTVRALTRRFIGEYDRNLEFTYRHHVQIDGHHVSLDVFDSAGKNSMEKLDSCVAMGTDLYFVLYSTTDRSSFEEASLLCRYLLKTKSVDPSYVYLTANKKDLEHIKEVDEMEGRFLAQSLACRFHQISVVENFDEIQTIVYDSVRHQLENHSKTGGQTIRGFFDNVLRKKSTATCN